MAKSPKILFVDDDRDFLAAQTAFFGGRGYEVVTVDRVEGALEKISQESPDVIVLDLMMEHYDSGFMLGDGDSSPRNPREAEQDRWDMFGSRSRGRRDGTGLLNWRGILQVIQE